MAPADLAARQKAKVSAGRWGRDWLHISRGLASGKVPSAPQDPSRLRPLAPSRPPTRTRPQTDAEGGGQAVFTFLARGEPGATERGCGSKRSPEGESAADTQ